MLSHENRPRGCVTFACYTVVEEAPNFSIGSFPHNDWCVGEVPDLSIGSPFLTMVVV